MQIGHLILVLGAAMAVLGLLMAAVAIAGILSYRVRRALPVASPIALLGIGGACFCGGVACAALGLVL